MQENLQETMQEATVDIVETAKKDFSKLGLMFLAGTAVIYAAQLLVGLIAKQVNPAWLEDPTINLILSIIPLYLVGMPALIFLVKKIPGTAPQKRSMKVGAFFIAMLMCYSVMYISNLVGVMITTIVGLLKGSAVNNAILDIATSANMVVTFIFMVICAPIMEEYIFRKLIVDRTRKYGQGVAIVLSGVMFGLFHGNLSQFVYAATLGMFFAFIYVKTGKLKITIAMHMIINFMGGIISTLVLKLIKYDELLEISASGDVAGMTNFVMENIMGWMVYLVYICLILAAVLAGIILFIVFRKRFVLEKGEVELPKGQRFAAMFLNFGMLVYSVFWLVMIVIQLFQ